MDNQLSDGLVGLLMAFGPIGAALVAVREADKRDREAAT